MATENKHYASTKQPSKREPAKPAESHRRSLITKWHKSASKLSLKRWLAGQTDDVTKIQVGDWLHNKRANFAKNPQCIGRTRTRVKKGGNKGAPDKNLSCK